jgi:hypothetical protein
MGSVETSNGTSRMTAVQKLRQMLADPEKFIACPGVYDGFTARIALQEGVDCLYMVCRLNYTPIPESEQKENKLTLDCRLAQVPQ